jgi:thiol-disulfide isomerase/thioredoxin
MARLTSLAALILAVAAPSIHAWRQTEPSAAARLAPVLPADALLRSAVQRARSEHKTVFVDFGASWCGPCLALEALLNAPEIRPILDAHFVVVRITAWEHGTKEALNNPGGDELMDRLGGGSSIPFYALLDANGRHVASSGGYPSDSASVETFLELIARGAPRMPAEARLTLSKYLNLHADGLGSVAGTVRDTDGRPLAGAAVSIVGRAFADGQWVPARLQTNRADTQGHYVIDNVPAGRYRLLLEGPRPPTPEVASPPAALGFYPAANGPSDATPVELGRGQGVTGLDISLLPPPEGQLGGRIATSAGTAAAGVPVTLTNVDWPAMTYTTTSGLNGTFTLKNLPAGTYALWVHADPANEWGMHVVTVPTVVAADFVIHMRPAGLVSGRVRAERADSVSPDVRANMMVTAVPVPVPGVPLATVRVSLAPDGTFRMPGLSGRRVIRVDGLPTGWTLAEVLQRGVDITDRGVDFSEASASGDLEVVLTRHGGRVSGTVESSEGQAVTAGAVVVFAEDAARWTFPSRFLRFAPIQPDGSFGIDGLPSGKYLVSAIPSLPPDWQAPESLERLRSSAIHATVEDSEHLTVVVREGPPAITR